MGRTSEKVWNKTWRILTTVLIAVVIPPGMAGWFVGYHWIHGLLLSLVWDAAFWGWPNWIGVSIALAVPALWFLLPWVGIVWLLLKIWKRKPPRVTEGKG